MPVCKVLDRVNIELDRRDPTKAARRSIRRLEALGFSVELEGAA